MHGFVNNCPMVYLSAYACVLLRVQKTKKPLMRIFSLLFAGCLSLAAGTLNAQKDTLRLSLDQAIAKAQGEAPDVKIAETTFGNNYWRYQSFLADLRPQISLNATLPDLNRSIEAITLPNGNQAFVSRAFMRNNVGIGIQQQVSLTGGTLFAQTGLQRIDIFPTNGNDGFVSYLSTPVSIGFIQPIFGFNQLQWNRRIEPLRYAESEKAYSLDLEQTAFQAANLFFDILIAQLNLEAAYRDKANADTLYGISKGRYEVGRIAETELLQIELNAMNANADVSQSMLNMQTSAEQLRDFLGINEAVHFQLETPSELPTFMLDAQQALQYARAHRPEVIAFDRRLLEAQSNVVEAKRSTGPQADLFVSFGLSQTGDQLSDAYTSPLDQEVVNIGLSVPIADWGKAKARREVAQSNAELTQLQVAQERVNFDREVLVKVQQFDLVREQVRIALRAYEIAQKRLGITRQRYLVGNILITDLNLALQEEAGSRRGYIAALRNFWLAYYDLRRLTLFDYERNVPLVRATPDVK